MDNISISRKAAEEGIVLLKNNGILPLKAGEKIAVLGDGQFKYNKSGYGSGNVNSRYSIGIPEGLKNAGITLVCEKESLSEDEMNLVAKETRTALVVISRNSGEFWDRSIEEFNLSDSEKALFASLQRSNFKDIIVILNIAEPINMNFVRKYSKVSAILLVWLPGMEGGNAVGDIISGKVNPSGHLTDTLAFDYNDYPCAENHHIFSDTVYYEEDIYVGYRYFETIPDANENVAFPFGHGLSYTDFKISEIKNTENSENISISFTVKNTGDYAGKDVVQIYVKSPEIKQGRPRLELKGFHKTKLLQPSESESVTIKINKSDLAYFDESNASFIISRGEYQFYLGENIRELKNCGSMTLEDDETVFATSLKLSCELPSRLDQNGKAIRNKWFDQRLSRRKSGECYPIELELLREKHGNHTLYDVKDEKITLDDFIRELSVEEMINLSMAQPPAVPRGTAGMGNNFARRIPNAQTADGPAGLRVSTATTCFPCATLLACTWNISMCELVGASMGKECKQHNIDILLAPALNIHRDPLCGRNFEYFSEDPLISGKCAAGIVRGIQAMGIAATIKHFMCNNQERMRIFSNSIVTERALREIYLKGFEIAVKESKPLCLMTSYNLVNNIRSSSNYGAITGILRDEWGYEGVVMTDWRTDSHLFEEIKAGNNIKMPFGYPDEIELAIQTAVLHNLSREELEESARFVLNTIMKTNRFKNADFGPINKISASGTSKISALKLNAVSHTFAGIEECNDEGGGQNVRRLEKDMRGNDCFVSYTVDVEETGNYEFCVRFAAEKSSSYMEVLIDGIKTCTVEGLSPEFESVEWNEDDPKDPHLPKKWVTSAPQIIPFSKGQHELKIYIRTEAPRSTMSIYYFTFKK